jgi:CheY-like chemotaxis protein
MVSRAVEARQRVMVVDDDQDTVDVFSTLIEMLGHESRGAMNGREAIELAASFDPHIVMLDIALPDISGYEILRRLRNTQGRRRFVVAATGFAYESDRKRALAAGFDAHLAKPLSMADVSSLMQTASRYL